MRGLRAFFVLLPTVVLMIGCPDASDPTPICIASTGIPADCTPAYEPTYDQIFANTLHPSCSKSGVSCHASTGRQGGLDFDDAEGAFAALTKDYVTAGSPECSAVVQRVIATDGKFRMPPGRSIDVKEQCAIIKWIANGAHR